MNRITNPLMILPPMGNLQGIARDLVLDFITEKLTIVLFSCNLLKSPEFCIPSALPLKARSKFIPLIEGKRFQYRYHGYDDTPR